MMLHKTIHALYPSPTSILFLLLSVSLGYTLVPWSSLVVYCFYFPPTLLPVVLFCATAEKWCRR